MSEFSTPPSYPNQTFIAPFQQVVIKMCKDMRFVGVCSIIYGAISCLSIFGAIFGIPIILMGLRMRESADAFSSYSNSEDRNTLIYAIDRLSKMFFHFKLWIIITLAIFGLYILIIIIVFGIMGTAILDELMRL